ncbi:MAG TPA: hypothetical protein H9683_06590 [Firmicutes bacterium]|nr:hypothetical protein [Bacillota bacterium]
MAQQQNKQNEQKKSTPSRRSSFTLGSLVNVLAFCALAAAAILLVIGPILKWILENTGGAVVMQALNLVSQYCLLAAIAIPGWFFVRGKRKGWKIAYFVFLVIYIAGTILGMTLGI